MKQISILGAILVVMLMAASTGLAGQERTRPVRALVLLGEWFGDAYFPLQKEMESRGWTQKRIGVDAEYRGCYNKKRDVVLTSDILIPELKDLSAYDVLIIPSGPQWRKFNENPAVLHFIRETHATGLLIASFCVGNFTVKAAGLIDLPQGPALFPEKVTLVKERILLGPRGGGPPPDDGFNSAPIKEICDAIELELKGPEPPEARAEIFAPGVISLPGRIEFCLALSPDGNEAFFAVRKGPGQWEIHRAEHRDGAWRPSVTAPFSGTYNDLEPTFSPDGRRLFFSSNRPLEGRAGADGFNLWLVERQGNGWSSPRPLPAPINGTGDQWRASQGRSGRLYYSSMGLWSCLFAEGKAGQPVKLFDPQSPQGLIGGHAFVSPDEDYLLTAWMDGPGHRGGWDIYISFRDGQGNWSPSVNLGDAVNTPVGEDFPLVSPNGQDLYFFRHQKTEGGEESGDIFRIDASFLKALREKALSQTN